MKNLLNFLDKYFHYSNHYNETSEAYRKLIKQVKLTGQWIFAVRQIQTGSVEETSTVTLLNHMKLQAVKHKLRSVTTGRQE